MRNGVRSAIVVAVLAALLRLLPLFWLHPLNRDEIEYFRATDWVRQGLVPFRDFWEHHTPLQWLAFAPATALTDSPGADAITVMRVAQIPLWMATFALLARWMAGAGIGRFGRWAAIALALCSSMLMTPAIEYRVDTLGCALFIAGLALAQRMRDSRLAAFGAGLAFCLAAFANLRLGPLLAVTAIVVCLRGKLRGAVFLFIGGVTGLAICLSYFDATSSLGALIRHVWEDNYLGEQQAARVPYAFVHRLLVQFGVSILGRDTFNPAAVDVGGAIVIVAGAVALVWALRAWRRPDDLFLVAVLQLASIAFIARMKFVYHYHLEIVVLLMVPLLAALFDRMRPRVVLALLVVALLGSAFASIFRGKELDRAYQDFVMREVHARTPADGKVWDGVGWAIRRPPAYRLWFLPELARVLVTLGRAEPYVPTDPPAAVIADHNVVQWLARDRRLASFVTTHYLPVWRNVWVPGLSGVVAPGARAAWSAPASGVYRVFASPELARHPWFRNPIVAGTYERDDASQLTLRLPRPSAHPSLVWSRELREATIALRKGERLEVENRGAEAIAVMLVPGRDAALFRQPVPGATLEGAAPRVTHVPDFAPSVTHGALARR